VETSRPTATLVTFLKSQDNWVIWARCNGPRCSMVEGGAGLAVVLLTAILRPAPFQSFFLAGGRALLTGPSATVSAAPAEGPVAFSLTALCA